MAADGAFRRDREVGLDELGQLAGNVVVHLVVIAPGGLTGVDVETGTHAKVITGIVRYPFASGTGIRRHQGDA